MPALVVTGIHKRYQDGTEVVPAVNGVTFRIEHGEFYTLLGESGCGKTTTLRCVAGLERPDSGEIELEGATVNGDRPPVFVPPNRRDIGMVFQSYAIWPHMSAFDNVAFPLRQGPNRCSREELKARVEEALDAVRLSGYEARMATQMSGGQQQRLALARALVRRPKLLLLDEPLSNLDAKLRESMRGEIRGLHRRLGISLLYVTHDQVEALSMSTRIGVMSGGRIVQEGTPREIYQRPSSREVAGFVGRANFLECTVAERLGGEAVRLRPRDGAQDVGELVALGASAALVPGQDVTVAIRPENLRVLPVDEHEQGELNRFTGTVREVAFLGETLQCRIAVEGASLLALAHPTSTVAPGDRVAVVVPPDLCAVIAAPGERRANADGADVRQERAVAR